MGAPHHRPCTHRGGARAPGLPGCGRTRPPARWRRHLQVNGGPFASAFQKSSPGFAHPFISGEAKMEQIINKLQTNNLQTDTGREGTKPTTSCCFFSGHGQGTRGSSPIPVPQSIPADPGNTGLSPGFPGLEKAAFNSTRPHPGIEHAQLPNLLLQLTATNNPVCSGPVQAKPYGRLHSSAAKTSNSQSRWPLLPVWS